MMAETRFIEPFKQVNDPRRKQGQRYSLLDILTIPPMRGDLWRQYVGWELMAKSYSDRRIKPKLKIHCI